ncbi:MAG TPA: RdgB/HAM1 family non-canonical purine NTP pyrophosphatase [Burkholderiaceae bacterium]|nr:RdgB/HAM1 family non-canonical purine NTP pyrophosphatase [Burkholderiaceae bacterium]
MSRIVLASGNAGKLREFSALLAPLGFELLPQSAFGVPAAEEPHGTFVENALAKARHARLAIGLPALADDSGICVDALGGHPGVWSARWAERQGQTVPAAEADATNNARLLADLAGLPARQRRAHYYCVLVLLRSADDPQPLIADASWHGEVIDTPRGSGGFGYDAHFLLSSLGRTAAELAPETKNELSHRGRAMRVLVERLREEGGAAGIGAAGIGAAGNEISR